MRSLSDRLVRAQRPIRILDAVKWDHAVERAFFAAGCRELPHVTRAYYQARPLAFDLQQKTDEFKALESDIRRQIGACDAPGQIMTRMCKEYRDALHMLTLRGTPAFSRWSAKLYGSTREVAGERGRVSAPSEAPSTGQPLLRLWAGAAPERPALDKTLNAQETVDALAKRLQGYFQDSVKVRVRLSDGILADAAAGCGYIKIRGSARFTLQDLRLLEVHEGWVHLGTSLNGQSQPICTFLSKGSPTSTVTQEGLAVLTEVATSASHPARMR
ncbi:MAG TPA: tyrosine/phenylalanine carboxypeptidase domain-containing protein, partial [Gemmataceae bacterium]|nr:tyrosine/phenylalanine carboxypeptidase domain-containing protein [Gemmataceae bacterium]